MEYTGSQSYTQKPMPSRELFGTVELTKGKAGTPIYGFWVYDIHIMIACSGYTGDLSGFWGVPSGQRKLFGESTKLNLPLSLLSRTFLDRTKSFAHSVTL